MQKLSAPEIKSALPRVPGWERTGKCIRRTYTFKDFVAAMKFVNAVARAAERAAHHPDVGIRWNRVTLALTTHDTGGLTERDFALAEQCDRLAKPR
jgi:4a-hydroxytetrahydrobiopterin dehydratase